MTTWSFPQKERPQRCVTISKLVLVLSGLPASQHSRAKARWMYIIPVGGTSCTLTQSGDVTPSIVSSCLVGDSRTYVLTYTSALQIVSTWAATAGTIEVVMVVGWHTGVTQAGPVACYTTLL